MDSSDITFKIEILGHLLEELNYWSEQDEDLELADKKYEEVMAAAKEMKEVVLTDIEEYLRHAKDNNQPIYLPYVQIQRDLKKAKFGE